MDVISVKEENKRTDLLKKWGKGVFSPLSLIFSSWIESSKAYKILFSLRFGKNNALHTLPNPKWWNEEGEYKKNTFIMVRSFEIQLKLPSFKPQEENQCSVSFPALSPHPQQKPSKEKKVWRKLWRTTHFSSIIFSSCQSDVMPKQMNPQPTAHTKGKKKLNYPLGI